MDYQNRSDKHVTNARVGVRQSTARSLAGKVHQLRYAIFTSISSHVMSKMGA